MYFFIFWCEKVCTWNFTLIICQYASNDRSVINITWRNYIINFDYNQTRGPSNVIQRTKGQH